MADDMGFCLKHFKQGCCQNLHAHPVGCGGTVPVNCKICPTNKTPAGAAWRGGLKRMPYLNGYYHFS